MLDYNFFDRVYESTFKPSKLLKRHAHDLLLYRNKIRESERFVISDNFLDNAVKMSRQLERIPEWMPFARLPFQKTWIELDNIQRLRLSHLYSGDTTPFNEQNISQPLGLLFEGLSDTSWMVTQFVVLEDDTVSSRPLVFVYDSAGDESKSLDAHPQSVSKVYGFMPGVEYSGLGIRREGVKGNHIVVPEWAQHKFSIITSQMWSNQSKQIDKDIFTDIVSFELNENRGLCRFIIPLLAMLYKAPISTESHTPTIAARSVGTNKVRYLPHKTVDIRLPKRSQLPAITRALREAYKVEFKVHVRSHQRRYTDKSTGITRLLDVHEYTKYADLPERTTKKPYIIK